MGVEKLMTSLRRHMITRDSFTAFEKKKFSCFGHCQKFEEFWTCSDIFGRVSKCRRQFFVGDEGSSSPTPVGDEN